MADWTLKTWPDAFQAVKRGEKTFEFRYCGDKDFQVGNTVVLREYIPAAWEAPEIYGEEEPEVYGYVGEEITVKITYVLRGPQFGISEDYCIFSFVRRTP